MDRVLVIDDDKSICESLGLYLSEEGYAPGVAFSAEEGLKKFRGTSWDVVILDIFLSDANGLDVLARIKEFNPDANVIMITAFHDMSTTVRAMKLGAVEYIHKPIDIDELEAAIQRCLRRKCEGGRRGQGVVSLSGRVHDTEIVGKSKPMKEIFKTIGIVSQSKTTVLIEGESGTGKELIARAIHDHTDRSKPFISINCSAIVETLLESELFGHEKGAFTGATYRKPGKFELADSGTLFLDEMGEMSLNMQVKLLRVMQEREFERVGGKEKIKTDVRIIAATNHSLKELVAQGKFREDLYYRLNVIRVFVPPLRDRREDIPLLVEYLVQKLNRELHKHITKIQADALQALVNRDWPGNIRQLENVLRRASVLTHGDILMEETLAQSMDDPADSPSLLKVPLVKTLDEVEKEHILTALRFANGNRGRVCELLGISRPTLQRKIMKYQIQV
ncbi:MAG TPA: sigma-54 dependent transcriptional regulator [Terriglobia bacterium]|nr:sigma-54 dependent transcriptional regulator [Terriglobia bacterium]